MSQYTSNYRSQVESSQDFTDPEEKKKILESIDSAAAAGGNPFAPWNEAGGIALQIRNRLTDLKSAGEQRRTVTNEILKLSNTGVNSKLQEVRTNAFLGSINVRSARAGG